MKVVLSRKGFDSGYGAIPSPIMPNGDLLSFPIPELNANVKYEDLKYQETTYKKILEDLGYKYKDKKTQQVVWDCHLDPDIYHNNQKPKPWEAILGQCDAAAGHLKNNEIHKGDLFLFFGTFRRVEKTHDGKYYFVKEDKEKHIIFGYLQIKKVKDKEEVIKYNWHPHAHNEYPEKTNNTLYIAADNLDGTDLLGYGVFKYSEELVLSEKNMCKSKWKLNHILTLKDNITYHENAKKDTYFQSAYIGQEFIINDIDNDNEDIIKWIIKQINGGDALINLGDQESKDLNQNGYSNRYF